MPNIDDLENLINKKNEEEQGKNPGLERENNLLIDGWQKCGIESTHIEKYIDGLFMPQQVLSIDEIKHNYLAKYKDFKEVELVPQYVYENHLGWRETNTYTVYVK